MRLLRLRVDVIPKHFDFLNGFFDREKHVIKSFVKKAAFGDTRSERSKIDSRVRPH